MTILLSSPDLQSRSPSDRFCNLHTYVLDVCKYHLIGIISKPSCRELLWRNPRLRELTLGFLLAAFIFLSATSDTDG